MPGAWFRLPGSPRSSGPVGRCVPPWVVVDGVLGVAGFPRASSSWCSCSIVSCVCIACVVFLRVTYVGVEALPVRAPPIFPPRVVACVCAPYRIGRWHTSCPWCRRSRDLVCLLYCTVQMAPFIVGQQQPCGGAAAHKMWGQVTSGRGLFYCGLWRGVAYSCCLVAPCWPALGCAA